MIYTKTGDEGTTSLVGGTRVKKSDLRVEAYGTVDELNSHIGLLAEMVQAIDSHLYEQLKDIQNQLFVVQTLLATEDADTYAKLPQLADNEPAKLEGWIDNMDAQVPRLKAFVIPGGSLASAQCHVARTVCRRAERCIVRAAETVEIEKNIKQYINRLSDYLFVASRYLLKCENKSENFWGVK
ncbi:MAG: cob(I)yrinic acid a,c-diamide adenosyltransferase [Bacteroidales bacterium]|nr:cob(I)yrinic acid a,c-diamide adenosyltransferase [Bacteroidales bacterium]